MGHMSTILGTLTRDRDALRRDLARIDAATARWR